MPLKMVAGYPPRGRPPTILAVRSPHRACKPRGKCWAPTPAQTRPQHVGDGPRQPARRAGSRRGGEHLTSDAPHNGERHPPRGRPSSTPTARNAGPQVRTLSGRCWVPTPTPTAPGTHGSRNRDCPPKRTGGRGGTAPDTRRPSQGWQATLPGNGPPPPSRHAAPTGHARQGDSAGPPHPHNRAHSTWVTDPDSRPRGRAVGGGGAPDLRRPSQRRKAPPPGMPFRHTHSEQRQPARAHAVGPVLGSHARTNRTRGTRVAEPRLPAVEDGRSGEGQRLTPDAPHNSGRPAPPGAAADHPAARSPHRACTPRGQCWAPTPAHPRLQHVGDGPRQPAWRAGSRGGGGA